MISVGWWLASAAMGEKHIRTRAEQVGAEVLAPLFAALGDLAVAADEANCDNEIRAAARAKARQVLDDAEAEIVRRRERWWLAWQGARRAGWTAEKLRSAPISQRQPPARYQPSGTRAVEAPGAGGGSSS
jgi:hypothetical protein